MVDKRTMHEPSIRIPLVVRYPALTKVPKTISEMVVTVDIAPSILELCEARPMENIHGKSWVKLVRQGDDDWRKSYLYHYNYEKQFPYTPNVRGVRTNDWKYVHYPHGDGKPDRHLAELYDLKNDPSETKNLIANPNYAAKVQELKNELERLKKQLGLEKDTMPLDEGIGTALPDAKIR
jgi:N-acetylglucosamine-6-sulfatase